VKLIAPHVLFKFSGDMMPEIKTNIVCSGCSLLCDDIAIEFEKGKIKKTHNVCARGYGRFYQLDFKYRLLKPLIKREGKFQEIPYEEALQTASHMLKEAKNPFFYGWSSATAEAQEKGMLLAKKYKGVIECASNFTIGMAVQQFLQKKIEVPNLSFIKDNADLLIFLGCNPTASHIRLLSKYALLARGSNTARGLEDRRAITIDIRTTDLAKFSQHFLKVTPGADRMLLESLIQVLEGKSFTEEEVANIPRKEIYDVANTLKDGRKGVLFFGNGYNKTAENMTTLFRFIEALNQKGVKIGAIPLDGGYNAVGFAMNLKKKYNLELNADFRSPTPTQNEVIFRKSLKAGEIDLLFILGADPISNFPFELSKKIAKIPIIAIDFQHTPTTQNSKLVIPTTIPGVESGGTAFRLDFEKTTLTPSVSPPEGILSDEQILNQLLHGS
jgi:formylmethanofuran dehydrogenase subunit B